MDHADESSAEQDTSDADPSQLQSTYPLINKSVSRQPRNAAQYASDPVPLNPLTLNNEPSDDSSAPLLSRLLDYVKALERSSEYFVTECPFEDDDLFRLYELSSPFLSIETMPLPLEELSTGTDSVHAAKLNFAMRRLPTKLVNSAVGSGSDASQTASDGQASASSSGFFKRFKLGSFSRSSSRGGPNKSAVVECAAEPEVVQGTPPPPSINKPLAVSPGLTRADTDKTVLRPARVGGSSIGGSRGDRSIKQQRSSLAGTIAALKQSVNSNASTKIAPATLTPSRVSRMAGANDSSPVARDSSSGGGSKVAVEVGTVCGVVHCGVEQLARALFDRKGVFMTKYFDRINGSHKATQLDDTGKHYYDEGSKHRTYFDDLPEPLVVEDFGDNNVVVLRYKKLGETIIAELLEQVCMMRRTLEGGQQEFGIAFAEFDVGAHPSERYDTRPEVSIPDFVTLTEGNESGFILVVSTTSHEGEPTCSR